MIQYHVDMPSLVEIERSLGMQKDKSKLVLRTAINKTAQKVPDMLVKQAAREYYIRKPSALKKTLKVQKATTKTLTAVVQSSGRVSELYDFSVVPRALRTKNRPPGGHKGQVLREGSGKTVVYPSITKGGPFTKRSDPHKAFVVKYKSGHITVAQRIPGTVRGTPRKDHPEGEEAIKNRFSLSIPKMLGSEERVYSVVGPQIEERLQQNIQEQMLRYLGG